MLPSLSSFQEGNSLSGVIHPILAVITIILCDTMKPVTRLTALNSRQTECTVTFLHGYDYRHQILPVNSHVLVSDGRQDDWTSSCCLLFQNPRFPGNLQMSNRQLDEAGENDVNNLWVWRAAAAAAAASPLLLFFFCGYSQPDCRIQILMSFSVKSQTVLTKVWNEM